jgi:hypothetical protein
MAGNCFEWRRRSLSIVVGGGGLKAGDHYRKRKTTMTKLSTFGALVGAAILCAIPLSVQRTPATVFALSLDKAEARLGRPLTPMSAAGVNRRVHRRGYYGYGVGAAGAAAAGAHYYNRAACGYYPYPPCY